MVYGIPILCKCVFVNGLKGGQPVWEIKPVNAYGNHVPKVGNVKTMKLMFRFFSNRRLSIED